MKLTLEDRVRDAWASTRSLVWKVLPFVLIGIGIGAVIHGFVPTDLVVSIGGSGNPLAVPALVLLGVPLYSNAAGTIPIIEVLIAKGLPMGSALAFMMAITALSFPEMVILRRVMKPPAHRGLRRCRRRRNPVRRLPVQRPVRLRRTPYSVIEVLGPGCQKCQYTDKVVREVVGCGRHRCRVTPRHRLRRDRLARRHVRRQGSSSMARSSSPGRVPTREQVAGLVGRGECLKPIPKGASP